MRKRGTIKIPGQIRRSYRVVICAIGNLLLALHSTILTITGFQTSDTDSYIHPERILKLLADNTAIMPIKLLLLNVKNPVDVLIILWSAGQNFRLVRLNQVQMLATKEHKEFQLEV